VVKPAYILLAVCAAVLLAALYYLWPALHSAPASAAGITNYPSKGTDIVAFGDSLVAGYGADDGKDFVSLLSQDIKQPIINLGEDGDTTAEGLARINQLDKYNPKVVILLLGGNDYLEQKDTAVAFQNLGQIIENIQSRGAVAVLVGVRVNYFVGNFDPQYEALVAKYKVAYVPDALDGILGNPDYMTDSVHPNNAGYALLAARILPVLEEVLK